MLRSVLVRKRPDALSSAGADLSVLVCVGKKCNEPFWAVIGVRRPEKKGLRQPILELSDKLTTAFQFVIPVEK
jgi:hypothetical protein